MWKEADAPSCLFMTHTADALSACEAPGIAAAPGEGQRGSEQIDRGSRHKHLSLSVCLSENTEILRSHGSTDGRQDFRSNKHSSLYYWERERERKAIEKQFTQIPQPSHFHDICVHVCHLVSFIFRSLLLKFKSHCDIMNPQQITWFASLETHLYMDTFSISWFDALS